jgi:hypothetical protein
MPEWYLAAAALALLSPLVLLWTPMIVAPCLLVAAVGLTAERALTNTRRQLTDAAPQPSRSRRARMRALTFALHLVQPLARTVGRLRGGLSPWRRRCGHAREFPRATLVAMWNEEWLPLERVLAELETVMRRRCGSVARGADYDRWDLELRGGPLGVVRMLAAVEEHGDGKQVFLFRLWPRVSRGGLAIGALLAVLGMASLAAGDVAVGATLAAAAGMGAAVSLYDCACAMTAALQTLREESTPTAEPAGIRLRARESLPQLGRDLVLGGDEAGGLVLAGDEVPGRG